MKPEIIPFFEPESCTWSQLVADGKNGKFAIIDPVWVYDLVSGIADTAYSDGILVTAMQNGYTVDWVLETHAHADYLSATSHIRRNGWGKLAIGRGI